MPSSIANRENILIFALVRNKGRNIGCEFLNFKRGLDQEDSQTDLQMPLNVTYTTEKWFSVPRTCGLTDRRHTVEEPGAGVVGHDTKGDRFE